MIAKSEGGVLRYLLSDWLSTKVLLDSNGNVVGRNGHLPFGEAAGTGGEQEKHSFTTYERDSETGLDYAINRGYSATIGRFQSTDPIGGSTDDPQSWNRYVYSRNDSVNRVDPLGLFPTLPASAVQSLLSLTPVIRLYSVMPPDYGPVGGGLDPMHRGGFEDIGGGGGQDPLLPLPPADLPPPPPPYDDKRQKCDQNLATIFGAPVARGNDWDITGYRGELNGLPGHMTNILHVYGSNDGTRHTTVFVPAGFDTVTVLGPGTIAFHYKQLGTETDVLLVVMHVANYRLGPSQNGRHAIGQTGGPGNENQPNYRHAHFEMFSGTHYPETERDRVGKRLRFSTVFCP